MVYFNDFGHVSDTDSCEQISNYFQIKRLPTLKYKIAVCPELEDF